VFICGKKAVSAREKRTIRTRELSGMRTRNPGRYALANRNKCTLRFGFRFVNFVSLDSDGTLSASGRAWMPHLRHGGHATRALIP
jgi:hypothetical protein